MWYVVSDLDRTIIHSKHPEWPVVERLKERPITHMTEISQTLLKQLLEKPSVCFIPCTMRNYQQVERVGILNVSQLEWVVCTNGAQIYHQGQLVQEWDNFLRQIVTEESVRKQYEEVRALSLPPHELRLTESYYLTLKFDEVEGAVSGYKVLNAQYGETYQVLLIGCKVFVIHHQINKLEALNFLIDRLSIRECRLITAGDTEVDQAFTGKGFSVLPRHASFRHSASHITAQAGICSTDELLSVIIKKIEEGDEL